jgi:biotin carboxyl carrier protein
MSYTIHSDILANSAEASLHGHTVTLSTGQTFVFEVIEGEMAFFLVQGERRIPVVATLEGRNTVKLSVNGYTYTLDALSERDQYFQRLLKDTATTSSGTMKVLAPMPGLIKSVSIHNGQHVKKGERLFILEAMKMENEIKAPQTGTINALAASGGTAVEKGLLLCVIEVSQ